jgi:hypothetical protein
MLVADQYIRGSRARRVGERWCGERGGGVDSQWRRRARAAPVLPRPHKSTKTADNWRACALVTCSTSLARPCLSRGSPTQSNEEWALHGRRGWPAKTASGKVCGAARSLRGGAAASRRSRSARPPTARCPPSRRPSERVGGGGGGLGEAGQGRGGARRQFASLRASERARREAPTRAAAKGELALEVTDAAGARGEARGCARSAQELGSYVCGGGAERGARRLFNDIDACDVGARARERAGAAVAHEVRASVHFLPTALLLPRAARARERSR